MTPARRAASRLKLAAALALAALLGVLVIKHVRYVNGSPWFPWRWFPLAGWPLVAAAAVAAIPLFLAQWLSECRGRLKLGLALLMLSSFGLQVGVACGRFGGFSFDWITQVVGHRDVTGYFTDAWMLDREFGSARMVLGNYEAIMPHLTLHSQEKPPGPVMYYLLLLRTLPSPQAAALTGGLLLAALAAINVLATYRLVRYCGADRSASLCAASLMALCPSMAAFSPMFDLIYPTATCALFVLWATAIDTGRIRYGMAFGLLLAGVCFMVYNLLVLGALFVGYALVEGVRRGGDAWRALARQCVVVLGTAAAAYALLYVMTGFDPIATFLVALDNQAVLEEGLNRPRLAVLPWDLWDFALGAGWISVLLAAYWFARRPLVRWDQAPWRMAALFIAQIAVVAATGLLRVETARVWCFLLPLLLMPAGMELGQWRLLGRVAVLASMWALLILCMLNMQFFNLRP